VEFEVLREGTASVDAYGVEYSDLELGSPTKQDSPFRKEIPGKPITLPKIRIENDMAAGFRYQVRPYLRIGNQYTFGEYMTFESKGIPNPQILGVSSRKLFLTHVVEITGKYFSSNRDRNQVIIRGEENDFIPQVLSVNGDKLTVRVTRRGGPIAFPGAAPKYDLEVVVFGKAGILTEAFEYEIPRILSISSLKAKVGEKIIFESSIEGEGIGNIYLNDLEIYIFKDRENKYSFEVPNIPYGSYTLKLGAPWNWEQSTYPEEFQIMPEWDFFKDMSSNADLKYAYNFTQNQNTILGYLDLNYPLFTYQAPDFRPTLLGDLPVTGPIRTSSMYHLSDIDNKFYFGLGGSNISFPMDAIFYNDFYRMDLDSKTWERLPDLPAGSTSVKMAFDWQGKICVVFSERDRFFFFDPITKTWEESALQVPDALKYSNAFDIEGNTIYFLVASSREAELYSYSLFSTPTKFNSRPLEVLGNSTWDIQKIEGKILVAESSRQMLEFDIETKLIRRMQGIQDLNAMFGTFFRIDGATYFGGRNNYNGFHHLYQYND
jgi:hypothetical protein